MNLNIPSYIITMQGNTVSEALAKDCMDSAKKFGLKLDANELGAMIKLNPVNRLRPVELGMPKGAMEAFERTTQTATDQLKNIRKKMN